MKTFLCKIVTEFRMIVILVICSRKGDAMTKPGGRSLETIS
jgi:hypothetical protein